jgi:pimeloyl-ACP methyl ester carboxylesterase
LSEIETTRISLSTGVTLKVAFGGQEDAEPIVFLHGFPESHRTWRHQLAALAPDFRVIAPDQRGFAGSSKPEGVEEYETKEIVKDLLALADALGIGSFTRVGHDWGGAVAWATALKHADRLKRLVIVNAPHPLIFQKSVIDDQAQREASQYIRAFRTPGMENAIKAMGLETFFEKSFREHVDLRRIPDAERQAYIDEWSQPGALEAMLNWYRASPIVIPESGEKAHQPLWTHLPFPKVEVPALVIWGMKDKALLPVQHEGLFDLVEDLRLLPIIDAGHFIPWEKPEAVTSAIRDFIADSAVD